VSLAPNPTIEAYKRDVDRTLLRENLRLSTTERVRKMTAALRFAELVRVEGGDRTVPLRHAVDFGDGRCGCRHDDQVFRPARGRTSGEDQREGMTDVRRRTTRTRASGGGARS
jgi:hypothetical protein